MASFDNIKDQLDIVEIAGRYTELREIASGSYTGLCPLHVEKTPSFRVDGNRGLFYCHGCQKGGDVLTFINHRENITYAEMPTYLREHYGVDIGSSTTEKDYEKTNQLKVLKMFCEFFQGRGQEKAHEYVGSRLKTFSPQFDYGLFYVDREGSEEFLRSIRDDRYLLKAAVDVGILYRKNKDSYLFPYQDRVVFPMTKYGVVLALNGRVTVDKPNTPKKYLLSSKGKVYSKKTFVYGLDYARELARTKDISYVYVTEGVLDTIALLEVGIPAVCVLGARVSNEQFSMMLKPFDTLYLTLDADKAGSTGVSNSLYSAFENGIILSGYVVRLPDDQDVTDFINANHENPLMLNTLPKKAFEDKIIDQYIILTRKSLADESDITFLKRKVLNKICEHLYDYKTNEFSKSLIMRLSERMSYKPDFIFSIIDKTIQDAHKQAVQIISQVATEKFSMIVDIADLRLLRLIHTFPDLYNDIQKKDWYSRLGSPTRDLIDIIVEGDANPKVETVELINRKVKVDKKLFNEYVQVLTSAVYKLNVDFNWEKELATLDRIYQVKLNDDSSRRLMKQVKSMQRRVGTNPYSRSKKLLAENSKNKLANEEDDMVI